MKKIAKFHKVSFDEFEKAWKGEFPEAKEEEIKAVYEELKLPKRATRGSAGYDFYTPFNIILKPGETVKIPTRHPRRDGRGLGAEALSQKRSGL